MGVIVIDEKCKTAKVERSFDCGYLSVSDKHEIYYEQWGNPDGIPILFIHGGPGAGFLKDDHRFFDSTKHRIIFFDQRGAGKSTPFASLKNNTTAHLIADTNALLDHINVKNCHLFGGSWGATLALAFAIQCPDRVLGILLRGLFLGSKESIKHYVGGGVRHHFPDAWQRFIKIVPYEKQDDIVGYYLKQMQSSDEAIREKYTYEWAYYEFSIYKLKIEGASVEELLNDFSYKSLSPLEAHYMQNNCFMPDNHILKNTRKLEHIPISIIHGRYDFICPPKYAFQLHERLPNSTLHIVCAGHAGSEPEIEKKIEIEIAKISQQPSLSFC
ncbi:MAG: prolyl aminopeptidase [Calditrichaeota bacterium]|nr:MAG: prolyl aminopeptidase [Calditrichota bacterium]